MSGKEQKDKDELIPVANLGLGNRSSRLVKRGLEALQHKSHEAIESVEFNRDLDEAPVIILVSRESIELSDTTRTMETLELLRKDFLQSRRNRVQIGVNGYDDDPRELFDIDDVRRYFQKLFDQVPGLFYWIDVKSYMFSFLGLMLYPPFRPTPGKVGLRAKDIPLYLLRGYAGLNKFCEENGVSSKPTNDLILQWLRDEQKV